MPIVTAHAVAVVSQYGLEASRRLEKAMSDAVLLANQEGISNAEENSPIIRKRMRLAHQRELMVITREEYDKQIKEAEDTYRQRIGELSRAHKEHMENMQYAHENEIEEIKRSILDAS